MTLLRVVPTIILFLLFAQLAQADNRGFYPLKDDDGDWIANHHVSADLAATIDKLPGAVVAGNPRGKVTLAEFYDVNCSYCREASNDIDALLRSYPELRLVLVPFPVFGVPSIEGARVELAVARLAPEKFYAFHRKLDSLRGPVNGRRALDAAGELGLDVAKVLTVANEDSLAEVMTKHLRLGNALNIAVTPGFVLNDVAVLGYPGPKSMAKMIESAQRCGKAAC